MRPADDGNVVGVAFDEDFIGNRFDDLRKLSQRSDGLA